MAQQIEISSSTDDYSYKSLWPLAYFHQYGNLQCNIIIFTLNECNMIKNKYEDEIWLKLKIKNK